MESVGTVVSLEREKSAVSEDMKESQWMDRTDFDYSSHGISNIRHPIWVEVEVVQLPGVGSMGHDFRTVPHCLKRQKILDC